jgi:hypothetical protein
VKRLAALLLMSSIAFADTVDVPTLIKLIENQGDLDRPIWKEKRRDAAKKLVGVKDKRAVAELIHLAETETFDVIGEIAIEGLGNTGDDSAIPVLQKIAADAQRDAGQRDLARKALAKLGATETSAPPDEHKPPPPDDGHKPPPPDEGHHVDLGQSKPVELPPQPELPDDTLAAYERIQFAGGQANAAYDTVRKRVNFDADLAASYSRHLDRQSFAWGIDADAHVVTGYIDPEGAAATRGAEIVADVAGEARVYTGSVYGIGKAATSVQETYVSDVAGDGTTVVKNATFQADLEVAIGGGYGRVIDAGAAIRVRRLARTLDAAHALGRPIDASLAKKLQLAWWSLRGERTTYRALLATVAILREGGVLLGEPDAGLAYEILNVLRDSQLYLRPSGLDVQLAIGEGYLQRPDNPMQVTFERGRVEQALVQASYGVQLADDTLEVSGTSFARIRLFADDTMATSPWAVGAGIRVRKFTYSDHADPLGALDATVNLIVSNDGGMMSDDALRVDSALGYTWWINQASGLRVAATASSDGHQLFLGGQLQITYGLLDGAFAR